MRAALVGLVGLLALALTVTLAGCAATPREQYEAAEILYTRTLQGLALAAAAGEVDADDLAEIEPYRSAVRAGLDQAKEIVRSGGELTEADARVFDAALNQWLEAMVARGLNTEAQSTGGTPVAPENTGENDGD